VDALEGSVAALEAWGLLTEEGNTATAPPDPGAPLVLYVPTEPPTGPAIVASAGAVYVACRVTVDQPTAETPLPQGTVVLDAKVFVQPGFDAGTTNSIGLATGASNVFSPPLTVFANAYDVSANGGAAVTGYTGLLGVGDTPQFLPVLIPDQTAVFIYYSGTGSAATQGEALVVLTLTQPIAV
jgi:hypothetical protein